MHTHTNAATDGDRQKKQKRETTTPVRSLIGVVRAPQLIFRLSPFRAVLLAVPAKPKSPLDKKHAEGLYSLAS